MYMQTTLCKKKVVFLKLPIKWDPQAEFSRLRANLSHVRSSWEHGCEPGAFQPNLDSSVIFSLTKAFKTNFFLSCSQLQLVNYFFFSVAFCNWFYCWSFFFSVFFFNYERKWKRRKKRNEWDPWTKHSHLPYKGKPRVFHSIHKSLYFCCCSS